MAEPSIVNWDECKHGPMVMGDYVKGLVDFTTRIAKGMVVHGKIKGESVRISVTAVNQDQSCDGVVVSDPPESCGLTRDGAVSVPFRCIHAVDKG